MPEPGFTPERTAAVIHDELGGANTSPWRCQRNA